MKSALGAVSVLVGLFSAVPALAASYSVDGLINLTANNFRSSVLHAQDNNGDMSGNVFAQFSETVMPGGTWDSSTGVISFSGSVFGVGFDVSGNINTSGGGSLAFDFNQADYTPYASPSTTDEINRNVFFASDWTFFFDPVQYGSSPANGFDGSVISLWGQTNTCDAQNPCFGIDLRVDVSVVPLPASALFLIAGLGGLGIAARKQKRS